MTGGGRSGDRPQPRADGRALITDVAELAATCERMAAADHVTVDTEFIRDETYFARLCLVQLATTTEHALVDPLALTDLGPLRELLVHAPVLKVFHAGRQDLSILLETWNELPSPVFDTQVAAALLGCGEQVGLAALVQQLLGVELPKGATMTDWSRRPLDAEQVDYAIADVVFLIDVFARLRDRLDSMGRLGWAEEEHAALLDPRLHRSDPGSLWRSVKGAQSLDSVGLAVLRELSEWREELARHHDRPRRWILSDEALVDLARAAPTDPSELASARGLSERQARKQGEALVAAIRRGLEAPPGERPSPVRRRRLSPEEKSLADVMGRLVRERAAEHEVAPSLLATRAWIERLATGGDPAELPLVTGWRRALVGADLLGLCAGTVTASVRNGALHLESR